MQGADGEGLIEVKLRDVSQLFETLDPFPFRDRDLARDAEAYIVDSARELPRDRPLRLVIHLPRSAEGEAATASLGPSISTYFRHRADASRRELKELFTVGRRVLLVGLLILAACLVLTQVFVTFLPETAFVTFVEEGLVIVGWVALWRPLEIFLYDWWPIARERGLFDRLAAMPVGVRFDSGPAVATP
jgi:hypothetical protein